MKKVKGADKTGKILKIGADTGKTLRRRKVLTKAIKKQITKHIRELNPTGSTDIYAQTYEKNFRDHISQ